MLDFVVVTTAFSPELRHMFNSETFAMMKPSSILINTSRGKRPFYQRWKSQRSKIHRLAYSF